jgi:CHASE2 domain-containing sensor protein
LKSKNFLRISIAIIIPVFVILASYFKAFETFELATLDLRFKLRPPQKITDKIIIIEIAEDTLSKIGQWPIDRKFHAALINVLTACGVECVIFDILFSTKSNPNSDALFVESVKKSKKVYLPIALRLLEEKQKTIFPKAIKIESEPMPELLDIARGIGHINVVTDIDGKRRRSPLFIDYKKGLIPHISFLALCDSLGVAVKDISMERGRYLQLKPDLRVPIDSYGRMLINYAGYWGQAFRHYSFIDILTSYRDLSMGKAPVVDLNELKGKICLVGLTAVATHDLNPIPLQERYPMVGLHANLLNTILVKSFIVRVGPVVNLLILFLLSALVVLAVSKLKPILEILAVFSVFFGFIAVSFALFAFLNIWIDLFYPLLLVSGVYIFCTFQQYITEQNKRIMMQRDLDIAQRIQQSFLKQVPSEKERLDIAVKMVAAKSVGGDLYDFVENEDKSFGLMVGDVSGKGVPAALFMAMTVSNFRFHSKTECDPLKVVTALNDQMSAEAASGLFVTLTYIVVDSKTTRLSIVDAGHLPIVYSGKDKETTLITATGGMAIGVMDAIEFHKNQIAVSPGDVFVLYSDGVTETRNMKKEEFGDARLKEVVSKYKEKSAKEITDSIYNELIQFRKNAPQHDDITIMALKIK